MKKTSYEISYDVITSIGERKTNEDAYGILELPDKKYFLVCDGLGGHGDYEKSEPITGKAAAGT